MNEDDDLNHLHGRGRYNTSMIVKNLGFPFVCVVTEKEMFLFSSTTRKGPMQGIFYVLRHARVVLITAALQHQAATAID